MATHLWVRAIGGGHTTLFQNIFGRVSEYRNVFKNVFLKVEKQVQLKTKWHVKNEPSCQFKAVSSNTTLGHRVFSKLFSNNSVKLVASLPLEWRQASTSTLRRLTKLGSVRTKYVPIFAFVGLGFAVQEESFQMTNPEFVCTEIRTLCQGLDCKIHPERETLTDLKITDLLFGEFIAKGSCAAVYEAKLAGSLSSDNTSDAELISDDDYSVIDEAEVESELPDLSSRNYDKLGFMLAVSVVDKVFKNDNITQTSGVDDNRFSLDQDNILHPITNSQFDLTVKMMFNYCAESTTEAVTKTMKMEMVPMELSSSSTRDNWWSRKKNKFQHPNIVDMKAAFVDQVVNLPDSKVQYPCALPPRLNPDGYGRNMTMYLVMKRYSTSLRDYLNSATLSVFERCVLIGQILEGVTHLREYEVAHRDLKSDNILIDLTKPGLPGLVITDFGLCVDELKIPYVTQQTLKGGNSALMAPEIACAVPGWWSVLDYRRSDLWTVGSLVYEVFGQENPFYHGLDTRTYKECELPPFPVPENCQISRLVKKLVSSLLQRDPHKRLEPVVAANVMQLLLWLPHDWLHQKKPSNEKVMEWLVKFSAAFYFDTETNVSEERSLKECFLSRIHSHELFAAVNFIFD